MNPADSARYAESTRRVEDVTTKYRLRPIAENILANLGKAARYPQGGVAFRGTVIVCGAGASLTEAIPFMRDARVPIIAVNNAAPALHKAGIHVDVVVSIESLNLSKHILGAGKPGTIVLDLMAHPAQWEAAEASGARIGWVLDAATHTNALAYGLGIEPHQAGGFATSTALELARLGGASEIVLAGMDFGYSTNRECAEGSGWGGLEVRREGDRLLFTGREDRDETHREGGVPPLPRDRPLYDVPAWGGEGTVATVIEWVSQRDWIAAWNRAVLEPDGRRMVNTSILGANIPGVSELDPQRALSGKQGSVWTAGHPVTEERIAAARQTFREEAAAARVLAEHFTKRTPWPSPAALGTPITMVVALASHGIMTVREAHAAGGLTMAEAIHAQYLAVEEAAGRMKRVYICHPFAGDPGENARKVRVICRSLVESGDLPIAPHLYLPAFLDEKTERDLALVLCLELIAVCDELRVYGGTVTAGMRREIDRAEALGIPVRFVEVAS